MIEVRHDRGVHLPQQGLWLDAMRSRKLAFVSHAHSDHTARHETTITTSATRDLMRIRMGRMTGEFHTLAFGEERRFGEFAIRLLPAGHVLGSSQCFITAEAGTLLYTGDFKLRRGTTTGAAESCHADILVMETTFGLPRYLFPPAEHVASAILLFCQEAIGGGATPVLYAYSLGKAQEVLAILSAGGLATMVHKSISNLLPVYEREGFHFPGCLEWDLRQASGCVVLCPPSVSQATVDLPRRRTAVITGWALEASTIHRMKCDAAFPLSDHAGYDDLLKHVENVSPKRVFTLHGFAAEFARDLRARGVEAWSLTGPDQLDLKLAFE